MLFGCVLMLSVTRKASLLITRATGTVRQRLSSRKDRLHIKRPIIQDPAEYLLSGPREMFLLTASCGNM